MTFVRLSSIHTALLIALPALLHGCSGATAGPKYTEPPVIFILVDASASIHTQNRTSYAEYLRNNVVPALEPGERVLVSPVGESMTGGEPVRLIDEQLPTYPKQPKNGWNDNLAQEAQACVKQFPEQAAEFAAQREVLEQTVTAKLRTLPAANRTYLLDGIEMAARALGEYHGSPTLIILSDGIEDSDGEPPLHFDRAGFWKTGRAQILLATLRQQGRIPDLTGTEVYFVGSPDTSRSTAQSMRVFWLAYLEAAGVNGSRIHFGPRPRFRPNMASVETDARTFCHTVR